VLGPAWGASWKRADVESPAGVVMVRSGEGKLGFIDNTLIWNNYDCNDVNRNSRIQEKRLKVWKDL
jgi:hypothetical protein